MVQNRQKTLKTDKSRGSVTTRVISGNSCRKSKEYLSFSRLSGIYPTQVQIYCKTAPRGGVRAANLFLVY